MEVLWYQGVDYFQMKTAKTLRQINLIFDIRGGLFSDEHCKVFSKDNSIKSPAKSDSRSLTSSSVLFSDADCKDSQTDRKCCQVLDLDFWYQMVDYFQMNSAKTFRFRFLISSSVLFSDVDCKDSQTDQKCCQVSVIPCFLPFHRICTWLTFLLKNLLSWDLW